MEKDHIKESLVADLRELGVVAAIKYLRSRRCLTLLEWEYKDFVPSRYIENQLKNNTERTSEYTKGLLRRASS